MKRDEVVKMHAELNRLLVELRSNHSSGSDDHRVADALKNGLQGNDIERVMYGLERAIGILALRAER